MDKKKIILLSFLIFSVALKYVKSLENPDAIIHFIKTGSSDSILIESDGHYGLIDSSKPYKYADEVKHPDIDTSIGEKDAKSSSKNHSSKAVLEYLALKGIKVFDFILSSHSHNDHIGGMPAIAYKYVNSQTKYYYRTYRETKEDIEEVNMANKKYYLAAYESMKLKKAQLIEISNKTVEFDFGKLKIEFLNNFIHWEDNKHEENQNSITTLIKYNKCKIFLGSDMISKDDLLIKDKLGKIDVLKLPHHGYSETSYEFLSTIKPNYVVITNDKVTDYARQIVSYVKDRLNGKVYLTENVANSEDDVENSAIRLILKSNNNINPNKDFYFENTGEEIDFCDFTGWQKWVSNYDYMNNGHLITGWKKLYKPLETSGNKYWFFFNDDGIMSKEWKYINVREGKADEKGWYYFDAKKGYMATKWLETKKDGKTCKFFFGDDGKMRQDTCETIDGKKKCFDINGCYV